MMKLHAIFVGLVVDEADKPVNVGYVGQEPQYLVDDNGFIWHIPAKKVDRQVLTAMKKNVQANKEVAVAGVMEYMGKDDLFTKVAVERALTQMDENMEQLMQVGLPEETRQWLGMLGFKVVINFHGDVVNFNLPGMIDYDE